MPAATSEALSSPDLVIHAQQDVAPPGRRNLPGMLSMPTATGLEAPTVRLGPLLGNFSFGDAHEDCRSNPYARALGARPSSALLANDRAVSRERQRAARPLAAISVRRFWAPPPGG